MGSLRCETPTGIREKLLARQRALFDDVEGLEADLRIIEESGEAEPEARGQGEVMTRLLDCVRERDRHELEEIHRALEKIAAGAYGLCETCREAIAVERLLVTPETRYCVDCARSLETMPAASRRPFGPGSHRALPPEYAGLEDDELEEVVRERIGIHGDSDLAGVDVRCHGGAVRLSGEIPSEPQRQVLVQIVADVLGLEVLDRLRVRDLDREDDTEARSPEETAGPPIEERIPAGRGMRALPPERWRVAEDEGEPPVTAPDSPIPEKQ
jgi:RNA polymerase-binding transcription factor DksA